MGWLVDCIQARLGNTCTHQHDGAVAVRRPTHNRGAQRVEQLELQGQGAARRMPADVKRRGIDWQHLHGNGGYS